MPGQRNYTKIYFTKNVLLQNKAALERKKTELENILNYLKN